MSAHDTFLAVHVAAGSVGLVLGPILFAARKRPGLHTAGGEIYHWNFVVLFVSAVGLALLDWDRVWWLAFVGAFSYAFALRGYLAAKRRRPGWLAAHVSGQGGSYIAMTTALLVVNTQGLADSGGFLAIVPWLLPTLIGTPLIAYTIGQVVQGKRPKEWVRRRDVAVAP
jgi:hypothetical protein